MLTSTSPASIILKLNNIYNIASMQGQKLYRCDILHFQVSTIAALH